jgi:glycosyltransferase 2 family protein
MTKKTRKKILKFAIKLLISAGFLAFVVLKTDWNDFYSQVRKISFLAVIVYLFVLILGMLISSWKWRFLASVKGFRQPILEFFKLYLTGTFINNFMPSFIAGDAFKSYEIAKNSGRYAEAASSVMMDRITGFLAAMVLAIFISFLNYRFVFENGFLFLINILLALSLVVDVLIAKARKWPYLNAWVKKILPEKITHFLKELYSYSDNHKILLKAVGLGIIFDVVGVAILNYILFWSLGIEIALLDYLSVIFIISIISALPISINNIGLKEWAYITFFGIFGVGASAAIAAAVVSRFLQMLVSFAAFPVYVQSRK